MSEVQGTPTPESTAPVDNNVDAGVEVEGQEGSVQAEPSKPAETLASLKKKLKLKVNGKELEEEVDLGDEAYLTRELQKSKAFDQSMKEYSEYKKQVAQVMEMLKNDPESLLEKLEIDVDSLAEKRLTKKLEQMQKSPEVLEKERLAKELEDIRKKAEALEKEKESAQLEKLRQQHAMEIEKDIRTALEKSNTVLPKNNPLIMHRIGQAMFLAMQHGYDNVTAADVLPYVEKAFKKELSDLFSVLPEDTIEALIGKEPLEKLRKSRIEKAKPKVPAAPPAKTVDTGKNSKNKEDLDNKPKKRFNDFFNFNT